MKINDPIFELLSNIKTYKNTLDGYDGIFNTSKIDELIKWCKKRPELIKEDILKEKMIQRKEGTIKHLDAFKDKLNEIHF